MTVQAPKAPFPGPQGLPGRVNESLHRPPCHGFFSKTPKTSQPPPNSNVWTIPPSRPKSKPCTRLVRTPGRLKLKKHEQPGARPSPNLAPTCRKQVHLFKIGGIQSGHHLKKTRGLKPPPNPNWHRSSVDKSRLELNKHRHPEARASPNRAPAWSRQVRRQGRRVQRTDEKTGVGVRLHPKPYTLKALKL